MTLGVAAAVLLGVWMVRGSGAPRGSSPTLDGSTDRVDASGRPLGSGTAQGHDGIASLGPDGHPEARSAGVAGSHPADRARASDWKPGRRREAWQRRFGDAGLDDDDDGPAVASRGRTAGGTEHHLHRTPRSHRGDGAPAGGDGAPAGGDAAVRAASPHTVFQSEPDTQYKTINQTEATELKDFTGVAGTISFWVQPAWDGASQDDAAFVTIGDNIRVYKNVNYLRFEITDSNGQKASLGMPIDDWSAGDWHHVDTTWNAASHQLQLIVDGEVKSENVYDGSLKLPESTKLNVGTNEPPARPIAPGVVADVEVRNRSITPFLASRRFNAMQPPSQ